MVALGFAEAFAVLFFGFPGRSGGSDAVLELLRLRGAFFAGALVFSSDTSFNGTLIVDFDSKKLLVIVDGSTGSSFSAYCSVTRSVMVRAFFLGALPFSGDEFLELVWLLGTSTSYNERLAYFFMGTSQSKTYLNPSSLRRGHDLVICDCRVCGSPRRGRLCVCKAGKHMGESAIGILHGRFILFAT